MMRIAQRGIVCVALLAVFSSGALAWGPFTHQKLADRYYEVPFIADLADEFDTDVDAVTAGAGELDFVGEPHHGLYHSGQWDMVRYREYVYIAGDSEHTKWYDIDDTTRLMYMMHNLGDVAVPIGHSPANSYPGAESGTAKELFFEAQADLDSYGSPSLYSGSYYTGTVSQCIEQYYTWMDFTTDHMANIKYFADNVTTGFLTVEPWANANYAANTAWDISQKLSMVILADYYLALREAAADAAQDITVHPGETAEFSASDLRDPDNIKWNSDGTYYYDAGWTGISQVKWDIDGNGTYETNGLEVTKTYAELAALIGGDASVTFGIEVTDDEGNVTYDSATLTTVPEPTSLLLLAAATPLIRRRKK
jgi:hypothetical protein